MRVGDALRGMPHRVEPRTWPLCYSLLLRRVRLALDRHDRRDDGHELPHLAGGVLIGALGSMPLAWENSRQDPFRT